VRLFSQRSSPRRIDTFNPQETTPNIKERGSLFSISEQVIFGDLSFLSSALSYKTFDVDVFALGGQPLTLSPEVNSGNYFADTRRRSPPVAVAKETYYARSFNLAGSTLH